MAKWSPEVLSEGFVPFPKKLLRTLGSVFGPSPALDEVAAILAVVDFKRRNQTREPSIDYLSFIAGIPQADLSNALKRLEDRGLIEVSGNNATDECEVDHRKLLELIDAESSKNE